MTGGHGHVIPRPDGAKARCGGPALCSVCAIELAQVQRERTAAGALLSLAAEFDRLTAETFAEARAHVANNDDDAALMASAASDAWRGAAARARAHARSVRSEGNEAAPVSREGQEPAGDLSALDDAARVMRDVIGSAQVVIGLKDRLTDAAGQLERAGRDAASAERERLAHLAEHVGAFYDAPCPDGVEGCVHQDSRFADLIRGAAMADKTLAQVAYEAWVKARYEAPGSWADLTPAQHDAWEAAVTAVIAARRVRNVVITPCADPGCGDGCNG